MNENNMVEIDFNNDTQLRELMEEYGDSTQMFFGKTEDGEDQQISINSDCIVVDTFQRNHWVRRNIYWDDGTVEETFEGKWN